MAQLFNPLVFRSLTLKNRIMVSPMCEYSSQDGFANDWHLVHLGSRAVGGAALVFTEATAVSPEGRITPDDLGLYKQEHIDMLRRIVAFIHSQGALAGIQLAHAGRKGTYSSPWKGNVQLSAQEGGWTAVAPSPIPFAEHTRPPAELDQDGLRKVREDFVASTRRAVEVGFDVVELHFAHGYLLHEFLSPLANQRTDAYGGSLENRMRLPIEVATAVRNAWPESHPLFVRISASDWVEGGWDIEQSVELSKALKNLGVDLMDCSSGGLVPHAVIPLGPGYQVPFAERIRKKAGIPTAAVGLITTSSQAEEILGKGQADLIVMAREFLREPYFPLHAAAQLGVEIPWPKQYERAKPKP